MGVVVPQIFTSANPDAANSNWRCVVVPKIFTSANQGRQLHPTVKRVAVPQISTSANHRDFPCVLVL
jgi:hypothetical protein